MQTPFYQGAFYHRGIDIALICPVVQFEVYCNCVNKLGRIYKYCIYYTRNSNTRNCIALFHNDIEPVYY